MMDSRKSLRRKSAFIALALLQPIFAPRTEQMPPADLAIPDSRFPIPVF
jgi:hypothetical protein